MNINNARIYARFILLLAWLPLAHAQNPAISPYPGTPDTDNTLYVATNRPAVQRTLNGAISSGATTMILSSGAGLLAPVVISIDNEILNCTTLSTNTLSGCTGGQESTATAAHSNGANVYNYMTAATLNRITASIKAIEVKEAKRDLDYIAGTGTAQAHIVALVPPETALVDGFGFCFKANATNTGAAPSIAVNGLTATTVTKLGNTALVAGDIVSGVHACVRYNTTGPRFELQNPQTASTSGGGNNYHTITTGTTPVLDRLSPVQEWAFTISTSNSTATTSGLTTGDLLTVNLTQCATAGGCTFTWPTGFTEACVIAAGNAFTGVAGLGIKQTFYWDGAAAHATTPCITTAAAPGAGLLRGNVPGATELSGDVTTSGSNVATLANTAVTPGSYTNVNITVDSKGRITAVSNGVGGSGVVLQAVVNVTAAQIKTLHASPITIVAAQGAGTYIEFISGIVEFVCVGCTQYTAGGNTAFQINGINAVSSTITAGNFDALSTTGILDFQKTLITSTYGSTNTLGDARNAALILGNYQATEFATGTGTLIVHANYIVHTGL